MGGKKVRMMIESMIMNLSDGEKLIFDFEGVSVIPSSFADEVFGKLVEEHGLDRIRSLTTFRNVDPFVSSIIRLVISSRQMHTV